MLVVDASCLAEVLVQGPNAARVAAQLASDDDQVAPHVIDVEVFGVLRRERMAGRLDGTAAQQAVDDLRSWGGERFAHGPLLDRAWQLRETVRGWDAMYVALAEAFGAVLLTTDARLAVAKGPRCEIRVVLARG